ncbi:hypothetical protein BMR1_03g04725 [Babesia microti strain RI]|uniref:Uncharacterized protein n=1 Tax=Babesia microti (strain RI) TaxID=1133968 RepID=A0A0K3APY1_BABMR|nr:hypothetical protein BMR1_03g04725 [Babesia microti strain RI]CTQ41542.1 hypothetical protein BMR1_03g04725 [Babesia microti strain RI]|eukprot:XP_012649553.1 hypothetical protein BMR1_03g04725 [Babesia microti strain RI]
MSIKLTLDNKLMEKLNSDKKYDKSSSSGTDSFHETYVDLFVREVDKKLQPECYDKLCSTRVKTLELWEPGLDVIKVEDKHDAEPFLNQILRLSSEIVHKVNKMHSGTDYTLRTETNFGKEKIDEANKKIRQIMKLLSNGTTDACKLDDYSDEVFISIDDFSETLYAHYAKIDKHLDKVKKLL